MTIENIPPVRIAYLRRTGPYGPGNKSTMEQLKTWAKNERLLNHDSVIFGIAQDNPQTTPPEDCRYDACLAVTDSFCTRDDRISLGQLDGGRYAVFTAAHTAAAIQLAWQSIFPELSRLKLMADATKPIIERYAVKMLSRHQCEICVPLRAQS